MIYDHVIIPYDISIISKFCFNKFKFACNESFFFVYCRDSTRLSKSEVDLLADSSAFFSEHDTADSSALDIDDEELMNEMEELLA